MANLPDGWSWLDEILPSWEPPEELRHPTKIPHLNLAVILLSSDIIGNDIIKLVGEHVAERSELTIWVAQHEPPKSFEEKFRSQSWATGEWNQSTVAGWHILRSSAPPADVLAPTKMNVRHL